MSNSVLLLAALFAGNISSFPLKGPGIEEEWLAALGAGSGFSEAEVCVLAEYSPQVSDLGSSDRSGRVVGAAPRPAWARSRRRSFSENAEELSRTQGQLIRNRRHVYRREERAFSGRSSPGKRILDEAERRQKARGRRY